MDLEGYTIRSMGISGYKHKFKDFLKKLYSQSL